MNTKMLSEDKASGHKAIKFFAPALAWGIFIFVMSLMPGNKVPDVLVEINDKLIHAALYFFAALLIYMGFIRYNLKNPIPGKALWFIIIICITFGGIVEVIQHYWIPERTGDWFDFMANSVGAIVCVLFLYILHGKRV